jgi:transposase
MRFPALPAVCSRTDAPEQTARFVVFRSHWRFEAEFCTPAEPHEKGGIEGEAGYFRRNHWVPVPEAADLADRNRQLLEDCQEDEHRLIARHQNGEPPQLTLPGGVGVDFVSLASREQL